MSNRNTLRNSFVLTFGLGLLELECLYMDLNLDTCFCICANFIGYHRKVTEAKKIRIG